MFTYKAKVLRIVDADTMDVLIDLGFNISYKARLRLSNIDAPELKTKEGKEAKAFVEQELADGEVTVTTYKTEKYGRYLALVIYTNREGVIKALNDELVAKGFIKGVEK